MSARKNLASDWTAWATEALLVLRTGDPVLIAGFLDDTRAFGLRLWLASMGLEAIVVTGVVE